ncbi:MAG: hypothetical protein KTR22_14590 [Flavobacteriaceae bacterium]|nr:hypothetical protein [Flavobacteriaceae bacterium]
MLQTIIHYSLHFLMPGVIAYVFFRKEWKKAWLLMLVAMLIDLDHLLATPIFDPNRCSINFHPLHTYWALGAYLLMLFFRKTRILGLGLVLHIMADAMDCFWMHVK